MNQWSFSSSSYFISDYYDDESIIASEFDEDSISLSWAASFNSSMDIADRIHQNSTDIVSEDESDVEAVEPPVIKKETKKNRSMGKKIIIISLPILNHRF